MTGRALPTIEGRPQQPAASLVEWASLINRLVAKTGRTRKGNIKASRSRAGPTGAGELLTTNGDRLAGDRQQGTRDSGTFGYRMAPDVAEHLVVAGLHPDFLGDFAVFSGLEPRDVLDFAGIDRTTVSRRKASGAALPQDAAVKALQATDLMAQATEVFGSPVQASMWLTKAHPSLDGETPLKRARTPWGMSKVQSILVALRYGGVA